jgi:DNA polymerase-3 subunit gamma/tau
LAKKLGMPILARIWQMLLKGLGEVQIAPSPLQAAEMVLVRLAYVADLPPPAELIKTIAAGRDAPPTQGTARPSANGGAASAAATPAAPPAQAPTRNVGGDAVAPAAPRLALAAQPISEPAPADATQPTAPALPQSFPEVVELFTQHREALLRSHLWAHCHLVHFEPGRIELRLAEAAPRDLPNRLGQLLGEWTGVRWVVSVSSAAGEPSLKEQADAHRRALRHEAEGHPLVRAVMEVFPGATIEAVRELEPLDPAAAEAASADDVTDREDEA